MTTLIKPERHVLETTNGAYTYEIGSIPYMAGGREIAKYYTTAGPERSEQLALLIFKHINIIIHDKRINLCTRELINNHVPDVETGMALEELVLKKQFKRS